MITVLPVQPHVAYAKPVLIRQVRRLLFHNLFLIASHSLPSILV